MSLTAEPQAARPDERPARPPAKQCDGCGAPLQNDQDWCLECGVARTVIHRSADWRIPAAIIATVAALLLIAFAIALINLSSEANRSAASVAATTPAPAATRATASTAKARPAGPRIARWPLGLPGWTVSLESSPTRARARAAAGRIARAGVRVGVLNSTRHPDMIPGRFIVFAGHYATEAAARARANLLRAQGYSRPAATLVARPGQ